MGARSSISVVPHPFPVVFDAFVASLPTAGFRVTEVDAERGRITAETPNTRLCVAVGAVDAITSEWMATAERKIGLFRDRADAQFAAMATALDRYLAAYYA